MKLNELKPNPKNPRVIRDANFKKLVESIKEFPEMMELRPMVVDENNVIQGGNMRYRALKEIGYKEIPDTWVKVGKDLTPEQWHEFVVKDNVLSGGWDWDTLANEWDASNLKKWGLDIPFDEMTQEDMDSKFNNDNCEYPLIPEYDEKYTAFIILCDSMTEEAGIKTKFNIPEKAKSYKNSIFGQYLSLIHI